jgi:hypothetical protein
MHQLSITGGARVGLLNASWPLAKLKVDHQRLELNAAIVGSLHFQTKDIIAIEPYTLIPLLGQGIKITHRVEKYNSNVIFWSFKNPSRLLEEIRQTGFLDNINQASSIGLDDITALQQHSGFPIKRSVLIALIVIWNLGFLFDFTRAMQSDVPGPPMGIGVILSLTVMLTFCMFTLQFPSFSKRVLKEGRTVSEVKRLLYFMLIVGGIILFSILRMKG